MNDDYPLREPTAEQEPPEQYFCKFTFGQFFTIMVLEIITVCFIFYLGARYGTEYLKIDTVKRSVDTSTVVSADGNVVEDVNAQPENPMVNATDEDMINAAKAKLKQTEQANLEQRMQGLLSGQPTAQPPQGGTPPVTPSAAEILAAQQALQQQQAAEMGTTDEGAETAPQQALAQPNKQLSEAEALLAAAAQANHPTQQQAAQAKPEEPSSAVKIKSASSAQYSVQVGAYPSLTEANQLVDQWKTKGYPAYMMIADLPDKGRWYRVRIGAFPSKDEAKKYLDQFSTKEGTSAMVVLNEE